MQCPYCNQTESRVVDSREASDGGIRRRRECLQCGLRFTTYERIQTASLMVLKRDGRREEFNPEKLLRSIQIACAKRPLPLRSLEKIVQEVETEIQGLGRVEVPSPVIGEMVMQRLQQLDRVAYIRFASVYRDFQDLDTFKKEVETLLSRKEQEPEPVDSGQLTLLPLEGTTSSKSKRRSSSRKRDQSRRDETADEAAEQ